MPAASRRGRLHSVHGSFWCYSRSAATRTAFDACAGLVAPNDVDLTGEELPTHTLLVDSGSDDSIPSFARLATMRRYSTGATRPAKPIAQIDMARGDETK